MLSVSLFITVRKEKKNYHKLLIIEVEGEVVGKNIYKSKILTSIIAGLFSNPLYPESITFKTIDGNEICARISFSRNSVKYREFCSLKKGDKGVLHYRKSEWDTYFEKLEV